ncbi:MAG: FecR domain-containing protein [Prolixibacteraceae bacterium]
MDSDKEQIYGLIYSYLKGQIAEEDVIILEQWKSQNQQNQVEFDDIVEVWRRTGNFKFPVRLNSEQALAEVHKKAGIQRQSIVKINMIWQVAAILILSVLFAGVYNYFFSRKVTDPVYYEEVQAAYGTRTNLELPDGSVVFLNSGSSLRFSNRLAQSRERRVELKGEGYFQVAKDAERPFIVEVGDQLSIEALGTAFNVNAYEPASEIDVVLIEGKVAVRAGTDEKSGTEVILEPNQLARYDVAENNLLKGQISDAGKYTGWTEGKLVFMDDPIMEVVRRMENWYNVDIQLKDERLKDYRFTGTFVNESLEEILNTLSLTSPLHYEIIPAVKNGEGIYSKRTFRLSESKDQTEFEDLPSARND